MKVHSGFGGWHRVSGEELGGLPGRVYFRVQEVDGVLRMTEVYIDGRGAPVGPGGLRKFPVQVLERTATRILGLIPGNESRPGPDLSRLAAFFDREQKFIPDSWVRESMLAQLDPDFQVPYPRERRTPEEEHAEEPLRLEVPADGRLTDAFLADVARAYQEAVERRQPPAKTLAALVGVSDRTVHRWVYTARKRGVMPPATTRGRVV